MEPVSVITASLNQGRFIEENILSVANQSYPRIEHLIIDGGSTDNTLEILKKYDGKLKWISELDRGFVEAYNKGIAMSEGTILNLLNADDYLCDSSSVDKAMRALQDSEMVFGDTHLVDENGKLIWNGLGGGHQYNYEALLCHEFTIGQSSAFFRKSVLDEVGFLETDLQCSEVYLWIRIGLKFPIIYVPKILSCYRIHPKQRTQQPGNFSRKDVVHKLFSNPDLPKEIMKLRKRACAGAYRFEAYHWKQLGMTWQARWCSLKAFFANPKYRDLNRFFGGLLK